jgi:hypothetical protein
VQESGVQQVAIQNTLHSLVPLFFFVESAASIFKQESEPQGGNKLVQAQGRNDFEWDYCLSENTAPLVTKL